MKKYLYIIPILSLLIVLSCKSNKPFTEVKPSYTEAEKILVDSILQYGLDHEALYTLLGDLKPMSSLISYRFPLANTDTLKKTNANVVDRKSQGKYLDRLYSIQQALNKMNFPDLRFVLIPYKASQGDKRLMQLSVVRVSVLDSLLKAKESFFGQFGLVPGADPAIVVSTIENADRYERNRGYGYLFGYPDYAVDFFIDAAVNSKKNKELASREFFQIPVYAGNKGYFVYVYPKEHELNLANDSILYYKAQKTLTTYKKIRNNYLNADSTVRAHQLITDYYKH